VVSYSSLACSLKFIKELLEGTGKPGLTVRVLGRADPQLDMATICLHISQHGLQVAGERQVLPRLGLDKVVGATPDQLGRVSLDSGGIISAEFFSYLPNLRISSSKPVPAGLLARMDSYMRFHSGSTSKRKPL
jgi:hypothetical protein